MSESIGQDAGLVWTYLRKTGKASVTKTARDCELDAKRMQRAIGWLAREDKLQIEHTPRGEWLSLR